MENTVKDTGTKEKTPILKGQVKNANSRTIFKNALLTSQFLRNYTNLSIFSEVKPEDIKQVYADIIWSLLIKMNVPAEEAREAAEAAEQKASEAERRANEAERKTKTAEQHMQSMEYILDLAIRELIQQGKTAGQTKDEMQESLQLKYGMKESEAQKKIEQHWN